MIRAVAIFLFVVVLSTTAATFWDAGTVVITLGGREYEMLLGVGVVLVLACFFLLFIAIRSLSLMMSSPRKFQDYMGKRRHERGFTALSRGMLAVAAGDAAEAQRYAKRAQSLLDDPPLTLLLAAQAAQLGGNEKAAETYFSAMLDREETEFLGLRGLFMQARRDGNLEAALVYVDRAYELRPNTPWVVNARLDLQTQTGRWVDASDALGQARRQNLLTDDVERRRRAVLLTAQAQDLADAEPEKALDKLMAALRLVPALVPAAILAARLLKERKRMWKAAGILETAWSQTPHPELARLYRDLKPDETPEQRCRRMQLLADMKPSHPESRLLMATLQLEMRDFDRARETLQDVARHFPTGRVCALMAEIEQQDTGDPFRAREWLARVPNAPRDAAWMCDNCHNQAPGWAPVCPSCHAFDSLTWRKPVPDIVEQVASGSQALVSTDDADLMPAPSPPGEDQPAEAQEMPPSALKKMGTQLRVTRNRASRTVQVVRDEIKKDVRLTRERLKQAVSSLGSGRSNGEGAAAQPPVDRDTGAVDLSGVTPPEPEFFQSPPAPDDPGPEGEVFEDRKAGPRAPRV